MPNGHDYTRAYGPHEYETNGTSDCKHECGCWAGQTRSGGPIGLDPFGECPNNPPEEQEKLPFGTRHEIVVERRLRRLSSDLNDANKRAERAEKAAGTEKLELERQLRKAERTISRLRDWLSGLSESLRQEILSID